MALDIQPSGQYTSDGEELYDVFYEGECLAANVLGGEIENIYIAYIMEEMQEDLGEDTW